MAVAWKRARLGAAERDGLKRITPAKEAVVFVQDELAAYASRTCARVGKQDSRKGLTARCQGEDDLHAWPTLPKRHEHAGHQRNLQIS